VSAQRPIRVGVAGLGRAFTLMLPTFMQDPRVRLVAACDPRREARAQFEADFQRPTYDGIEGLAGDPDVEVIYVASPHQFHGAQTRVAARHGKHVLVEKPMALTLADCDAMIDDCRDAGVRLIVGHCHSFDEPYRHVRRIIDEGKLGSVRMIHALNYTDFLYRPRRPEELDTGAGGGAVFSQAAHQVDIVRMLAGSPVARVRAATGAWDPQRPTEGAYALLMWFADGAFANLSYSGYGHFDSDEWCDWTGEMGGPKRADDHGAARRRLAGLEGADAEAKLKAAGTYGGQAYRTASHANPPGHQHFGPIIVSCDRADLRAMPGGVWIYGDDQRQHLPLPVPPLPRYEVIDELYAAVVAGRPALHEGAWARSTLEVCLAILQSAREGRDVELPLRQAP
jgi:phthalate 4,5-cis-dihydrodiol dehydrogenase